MWEYDIEGLVRWVHWCWAWPSMRTWLRNSMKFMLENFSRNFTTLCKNVSAVTFSQEVHVILYLPVDEAHVRSSSMACSQPS